MKNIRLSILLAVNIMFAFVVSCSSESDADNKSSSSYSNSTNSNSVGYKYCRDIRYDSSKLGCCGVTLYLLETQGCEGNDLVKEKCDDGVNLCFAPAQETYQKCGDAWYGKATLGCCGNTVYALSSQFCSKYNTVYNKCGGNTYDPVTQGCCGNKVFSSQEEGCDNGVVKQKCGSIFYDEFIEQGDNFIIQGCCGGNVYHEFIEQGDDFIIQGCCGGNVYNFDLQYCSGNNLFTYKISSSSLSSSSSSNSNASSSSNNIIYGASLTDTRDNKTYKTVVIGTQIWMAENLNYDAEGSKCYRDNSDNCEEYGRLYDWGTATKACPGSWHLPSDKEWGTLMQTVNPSCSLTDYCSGAGTKLKTKIGWYDNGNGTDDFGFAALPGSGPATIISGSVGSVGYWWSATEYNTSNAYYRNMDYRYENVYRGNYDKSYPFSIRCVRD